MQLNYHLYMNYTGYSCAAQDYILAMLHCRPEMDIKTHYINLGSTSGVSRDRGQLFGGMNKKEKKSPHINFYHSIPHRYRRPKDATKNIGFCIFETLDPPVEWIRIMNDMDGIITASEFNKNVFKTGGLKCPISVVPHCFDSKMFNKNIKPTGRYNLTTFISIGTWKERKNWELLIKAWYDAFESKDQVCLVIKTDKPRDLAGVVERIKRTSSWRSKATAPIYAEESINCVFEDIPGILKKGDIYVSASMGEGFGLSTLHAMALGMPVITPRYGGTLEFASSHLCTHIEPKEYKRHAIMDGIPQFANKIWPVLTIGEVRDKMRHVFTKREECSQKAELAYRYVHKYLSYDAIGNLLLKALGYE